MKVDNEQIGCTRRTNPVRAKFLMTVLSPERRRVSVLNARLRVTGLSDKESVALPVQIDAVLEQLPSGPRTMTPPSPGITGPPAGTHRFWL